jgi:hypothetical protein
VSRGELFTLGRHYLSANVMIEMSPLWILTPAVFMNAEDPSALFQLVTTYSLSDNMTFLGSVNKGRAAVSLAGLSRACQIAICRQVRAFLHSSPGISRAGT